MTTGPEIRRRLIALQKQGRYAAALELCTAALANDPSDVRLLALAGALALHSREFSRAIDYLRRAASSSPHDPAVRVNLALALQEAGLPAEAAEVYAEVLHRDPRHVGANVNLGTLLMAEERWDEALECFDRALDRDPDCAAALSNRARALHGAGRFSEAAEACDALLAAHPESATGHALQGILLSEAGRLKDAAEAFRRSLDRDPRAWRVHRHLGVVLRRLGDAAGAAAALRRAHELNPQGEAPNGVRRRRPAPAEPLLARARALLREGRPAECESVLREILVAEPNAVPARHLLGVLLVEQGDLFGGIAELRRCADLDPGAIEHHLRLAAALRRARRPSEAIPALEAVLLRRPRHKEALRALAACQATLGRREEAAATCRRLLAIDPADRIARLELGHQVMELGNMEEAKDLFREAGAAGDADGRACLALGILAERQERLAEALTLYHRAVELNPALAEALVNIGNVHHELHRFPEAEAAWRRAEAIRPGYALAEHSLAMMHLLLGDYERGLRGFEQRWRRDDCPPLPAAGLSWEGQPFDSLLVMHEGGIGDTLHFLRYLPEARARGGRIVFRCQRGLLPLLAGLPGADLVVDGPAEEPCRYWAPLMSLPLLLGCTEGPAPPLARMLRLDTARTETWRQRLPSAGFRVGLFWQGNPRYSQDRRRSVPLRVLLPLAAVPGVAFVSLQKGPGREQLVALRRDFPAFDAGALTDPPGQTFMDTAAILNCLDLLITSDSAIAHLAGTLGVRTWLLLPFTPDWRWGLEGESTRWYPGVRLFRQRTRGDWAEVASRVAEELRMLSESATGPARRR